MKFLHTDCVICIIYEKTIGQGARVRDEYLNPLYRLRFFHYSFDACVASSFTSLSRTSRRSAMSTLLSKFQKNVNPWKVDGFTLPPPLLPARVRWISDSSELSAKFRFLRRVESEIWCFEEDKAFDFERTFTAEVIGTRLGPNEPDTSRARIKNIEEQRTISTIGRFVARTSEQSSFPSWISYRKRSIHWELTGEP